MFGGVSRRKRLIVRTAAAGGLLVLGVWMVASFREPLVPYRPGERMAGLTDELSRGLPSDFPRIRFVDVSIEAGIDFKHFQGLRSTQLPEDMGSGAAWGDYDNDGYLDLYIVNEAGPLTMSAEETARSQARNSLYRNQGDGTFVSATDLAGVGYRGCGQAAAWGDFDNDGFLDLLATSYDENVLFHNQGDGTFENVSEKSGVSKHRGFWSGASWGDYDRDGDLDLYICGYVRYRKELGQAETPQYNTLTPAALNPSTFRPERNLLFRNRGNGTFEEVAQFAGVENPEGRSLSASWCDFDKDGWVDLYVANDVSDNMMYRNRGDGTFEDISHNAWVADYRGAMGLAIGDWDGDEDLDLFVTHWIAQENALYNNLLVDLSGVEGVSQIHFSDVADRYGLGQIALDQIGWGTAFLDYDSDGRLDLFVVNGSTFQHEDNPRKLVAMPMQLFWNKGPDKGFFEVGPASGLVFENRYVGRGLAIGDFDNDGDPDAFVVVHGEKAMLLRNDGENANGWLKVRLQGSLSNRFGLGAKLRVVAGGRAMIREVGAGSSYVSQHAVGEELFGLGSATSVDTLEVSWPSGLRQLMAGVEANQTVVIREEMGLQDEKRQGTSVNE